MGRRVWRLGFGFAQPSFDGGYESGLFAAYKSARPAYYLDREVKPGSQDVFPQQPKLPGSVYSLADMFDGEWVLVAYVEISLVGAEGISTKSHTLDDTVGIALQDCAVHVSAGIALVAVADNVLRIARGIAADLPLATGGESPTTPPAQPGANHLVNYFLRRQVQQGVGKRMIALPCYVFLDADRVNQTAVSQNDLVLARVEGQFIEQGNAR
jgi:hypothetical protein